MNEAVVHGARAACGSARGPEALSGTSASKCAVTDGRHQSFCQCPGSAYSWETSSLDSAGARQGKAWPVGAATGACSQVCGQSPAAAGLGVFCAGAKRFMLLTLHCDAHLPRVVLATVSALPSWVYLELGSWFFLKLGSLHLVLVPGHVTLVICSFLCSFSERCCGLTVQWLGLQGPAMDCMPTVTPQKPCLPVTPYLFAYREGPSEAPGDR